MSHLSFESKEKLKPKSKGSTARVKISEKVHKGSPMMVANQGDTNQPGPVKNKFIKMRSETEGPKDIQENDRDGRINFALDMVARDLVCQGHVDPSKAAYMLKSDQMKEHIGRLCDEMTKRRKAEFTAPEPKSRYYKQKESFKSKLEKVKKALPTEVSSGIFNSGTATKLASLKSGKPQGSEESSKADIFRDYNALDKIPNDTTAKKFSKTNVKKAKESRILETKPKTTEGKLKTANSSDAEISPDKHLDALLNYPPSFRNSKADVVPFRTRIDLAGFSNDNISMNLNGRRLVVVGFRPRDKVNHARKITEIIDIPIRVQLDNLHITRRKNGALLIEEILPSSEASFQPKP